MKSIFAPITLRNSVALVLVSFVGWWLWRGLLPFASPAEALSGAAAHYVNSAEIETGARNVVAAILYDYRAFDTLGEITVTFAVVTGIALLFSARTLKVSKEGLSSLAKRGMALMAPFILLYGASIVLLGHLTPGGGFQGGTVLATLAILLCIVYGTGKRGSQMNFKTKDVFESLGAMLFLGVGLVGLVLGTGFFSNLAIGYPQWTQGSIATGGHIPVLNVAVGIKVGVGLSSIFFSMAKVLEVGEDDEL